jgi:preprotein translocase subunit SecG
MPRKLTVDHLVYAFVIILCLIVLVLVLVSPPEFTDIKNAYQGF